MKIKKDNGTSAEIWDAGAYPARVVGFYGIGTQLTKFGDKSQYMMSFEIFDDERSKIISTFPNTLSLNSKAHLTKIIKGILGGEALLQDGDFDVSTLVGAECQVSVVETKSGDKTYNNFEGVLKLMKGVKVPESDTKLTIFGVNADGTFEGDISEIPSFIADKVRDSKEVLEASLASVGSTTEEAVADNLPF